MEELVEISSHCFYQSPIGVMEFKCAGEILTSIEFISATDVEIDYPQHKLLASAIHQFDEYFDGKRKHFDLPSDQAGTDFQQSIWPLVKEVPFGKTLSYLELAKKTGNVKSIRAASKANGKNKLAILVPCHRIIGTNDELVGYAWGLWRKKWLLDHEAKIANGVQTLF